MKRVHVFVLVAACWIGATSAQQPQQQRRESLRAVHPDVSYGSHERNVMDVWLAESDEPTPVLVSIHGGGFRGGNKSVAGNLRQRCLQSGAW